MAQVFIASIYRVGTNDLTTGTRSPANMGVQMYFPTSGIRLETPKIGTVGANNVTINSVIALLPQGLNQPEKLYYSSETLATLATRANAALT